MLVLWFFSVLAVSTIVAWDLISLCGLKSIGNQGVALGPYAAASPGTL
jgi:hypothetical protein